MGLGEGGGGGEKPEILCQVNFKLLKYKVYLTECV